MSISRFPQLKIEPLSKSKLKAASEFLHNCWMDNYQHQLPSSIIDERTPEYFQRYLASKLGQTWLACLGERVVGLVTVASNCIDELWVKKRYQRRKIGSRLVDTAVEHFRHKGFNSAQVGFESFNQSTGAFFVSREWKNIGSEYVSIEPGKKVQALVYSTSLAAGVKNVSH